MTHVSTADFWSFLREVIIFAVDDNSEKRLIVGHTEIARITEDVFLGKLYAARRGAQLEEELARAICTAGPVICLVGSRGSGKTSLLRYVTKRLLGPQLTDTKVVLLDYKAVADQYNAFRGISTADAVTTFRRILSNRLLDQLFPETQDHRLLAAWLLAGPPDASDAFRHEIVADLTPRSMEFLAKDCKDGLNRRQRTAALETLFAASRPDATAAIRRVIPAIRPAQVIQAAVSLGKTQRVLLVHDNIDRVEGELQAALLDVTVDMHVVTADVATTIVAIRRENITPRERRPGYGSNFLVRVSVDKKHSYPAYLIPYEANSGHSESVLRRRYEWALEQLLIFSPDLANLLKTGDSPGTIHERVLGSLIGASVDDLSNGSLRNSILIYLGFWQFLIDADKKNHVEISSLIDRAQEVEADKPDDERHEIRKAKGHLNTLFFLWLGQSGRDYGVRLYDLMKADEPPYKSSTFAEVASAHHLLLTCLLNLEKRFPEGVPFAQAYNRLSELGFSLAQIAGALNELAGTPGDIPMAVDFIWRDEAHPDLNEGSPDPVRLTPMGKRLITDLFSKVGYVWASSFMKLAPPQQDRSKPYWASTQEERSGFFRDRLRGMARRHLGLMVLLRRLWDPRFGSQWLERYRDQFAVESLVHVERLLHSAIAFYRVESKAHDVSFAGILQGYQRVLRSLEGGTPESQILLPESLAEHGEKTFAEVFR